MDLQNKRIVVFGGSGFIGKSIVRRLAKAGARVTVVTRRPAQGIFLKTMGEVGQVTLTTANFRPPSNLSTILQSNDVVINLIGQLHEQGSNSFTHAHADIPVSIAHECVAQNIKTLIHVSALGADLLSPSCYARSKAQGEVNIAKIMPVTILRPSVVFGADDRFFNRFAAIASLSPILPVFGGGRNKMQPIYVEDVAQAVINILSRPETQGKTYELGGPEVYTFKELMTKTLAYCHRKRLILSLPYVVGSIMGKIMAIVPNPPLTADQVNLLKKDNIVSENMLTCRDLFIQPQSIEAIVPPYLARFKPHF